VLNDSNSLGKYLLFQDLTGVVGPRTPHCWGFKNTLRHTTFDRTPLGVWSARRRDLYLTIHNIHRRETSMLRTGFDPAIPASEGQHAQTLDRAATGWVCSRLAQKTLANQCLKMLYTLSSNFCVDLHI
jgi:hypothetical protein